MTIILGWWLLPTAVTTVAWFWYFSRPAAPPVTWDFGGSVVDALVHGGVALMLTLLVWLLYFAALVFLHG